MQVFIWLHRIAMQLNFFSNYKLDSENFRCRDFICTYIYVIICIILSVIYSMYFFSNDFVNWNCQITINNTCSIDEFKGGGGCCKLEKVSLHNKIIHLLGSIGGIISGILFIIMFGLHTSKIIQCKVPVNNELTNEHLAHISTRPTIDDSSVTEIPPDIPLEPTIIHLNNNNHQIKNENDHQIREVIDLSN